MGFYILVSAIQFCMGIKELTKISRDLHEISFASEVFFQHIIDQSIAYKIKLEMGYIFISKFLLLYYLIHKLI